MLSTSSLAHSRYASNKPHCNSPALKHHLANHRSESYVYYHTGYLVYFYKNISLLQSLL